MNSIDILIIIVILLSLWSGYRKGFLLSSINLITWAGSLIAGFVFYTYLAYFFELYFTKLGVWIQPVSFIVTILIARLLLAAIFNRVLQITPEETHHQPVNRIFGVLPGFINGLINATILAALLLAVPLFNGISSKTRASKLANKFVVPAEWVERKLAPVFSDAVHRSLNKMTVEPRSHESVKLHYTVTDPQVRQDLEAKMLDLINEERQKVALPPVKADPELAVVARAHSKDMFARGYFAHINLNGKDPFSRIKEAHIRFTAAGENLALAQTLTLAHNGLMNSPGHRANILHRSFGRVGIGILDGGIYGLMVTQNFRN
jgi:uncharacterized protein YkwD